MRNFNSGQTAIVGDGSTVSQTMTNGRKKSTVIRKGNDAWINGKYHDATGVRNITQVNGDVFFDGVLVNKLSRKWWEFWKD